MSDSDDLDDFMDSIGLDVKPASAEDALMIRLTGQGPGSTKYKEIYNLRYELIHDLYSYFTLTRDGCILVKEDKKLGKRVEFTKVDYLRSKIKYRLRMRYLPYFNSDRCGLGPADLEKTCDLVMAYDAIAKLLACTEEELPKMHYAN